MASLKGTTPTEGLPGAPTLTVFRVRTEAAGAATDAAGPARAARANRANVDTTRFLSMPSTLELFSMTHLSTNPPDYLNKPLRFPHAG